MMLTQSIICFKKNVFIGFSWPRSWNLLKSNRRSRKWRTGKISSSIWIALKSVEKKIRTTRQLGFFSTLTLEFPSSTRRSIRKSANELSSMSCGNRRGGNKLKFIMQCFDNFSFEPIPSVTNDHRCVGFHKTSKKVYLNRETPNYL